ncbi:synaptophysin-like protein 1 [Astyanax mexicanus]|uniref:Synaptophysin-like protein 1 n=2 Tax=Astyanax mexicanus TaxID=7994 RepID=A0A8T2MF24_ASTMX|nr:synaptophysin-like protein 1 [Astyanax mexicanus]KAG9280126.1 synaptophysin-like protein 1 [Astyanax mexicanus]
MQTGFRFNWSPVKEPLGFVKVVEWLTAVFSFASCSGFSGRNFVSLFCAAGNNETLDASFSYPFRLNQVRLVEGNVSLCNHTSTETHLVGDSSSSAEFFVAVAVLAFLYSMAALLVYVGYMHVYRDSDFGPMFDFVVTAAFAFLWLVSSSAWARGLQVVKYATGTEGIASTLLPCRDAGVTCEVTEFTSMRTLNISVVFGFLNLIVWAGNAWFVYKETRWHSQKVNSQPAAGRGPGPAPI